MKMKKLFHSHCALNRAAHESRWWRVRASCLENVAPHCAQATLSIWWTVEMWRSRSARRVKERIQGRWPGGGTHEQGILPLLPRAKRSRGTARPGLLRLPNIITAGISYSAREDLMRVFSSMLAAPEGFGRIACGDVCRASRCGVVGAAMVGDGASSGKRDAMGSS